MTSKELSPTQKEEVFRMIREREPVWRISGFLMKECKVGARDAFDIRKSLIEEYESKPTTGEAGEAPHQSAGQSVKTETPANDEGASVEKSKEEEQDALYDHCITCQKPDNESCDCEVKKPSHLPF